MSAQIYSLPSKLPSVSISKSINSSVDDYKRETSRAGQARPAGNICRSCFAPLGLGASGGHSGNGSPPQGQVGTCKDQGPSIRC